MRVPPTLSPPQQLSGQHSLERRHKTQSEFNIPNIVMKNYDHNFS